MLTREEYADRIGAAIAEEPDVPDVADHVWTWFWTLSKRRQRGFDGASPLTYSEIDAWLRVTRTIALPQEIDLIMAMDSAWLEAVAEMREQRSEERKK